MKNQRLVKCNDAGGQQVALRIDIPILSMLPVKGGPKNQATFPNSEGWFIMIAQKLEDIEKIKDV